MRARAKVASIARRFVQTRNSGFVGSEFAPMAVLRRRIGHALAAAAGAAAPAAAGPGACPAVCGRGGEVSVRPAAVSVAEAVSAGAGGTVGGVGAAE